ncbi:MAG: guanine deaminase [Kiloniellaceae bacterium]
MTEGRSIRGPRRAVRGRVLSVLDDPAVVGDEASYRYIEDGLVVVEGGCVADLGEASSLLFALPAETPVDHYPGCLVVPGLIDSHIHYPQTQVIASHGGQLLEWLERYAFSEERKFADPEHAKKIANFFLDELLRNGTTTAAVYCTVRPESAEAFFSESERRKTCMIAGKVMMDRNAPPGLLDTAERGYAESKALLERWHGTGRQLYAITPRFAVTSSEAQLAVCGDLLREFPSAYLQTHLSETRDEIETVRRLFPKARSYTEVYDRAGLLGPRSIFGHGLHLEEPELRRLSETSSVVAFCPTSNLFMGSGLLDLARLSDSRRPVRVSLATDVGGGTSYSMLRTAGEAYKVSRIKGRNLRACEAFYLMTLGNARALGLAHRIGTLEPGTDADITILDARATPAMAHRMETIAGNLPEELFLLMTLGDDRAVRATYVMGERVNAV